MHSRGGVGGIAEIGIGKNEYYRRESPSVVRNISRNIPSDKNNAQNFRRDGHNHTTVEWQPFQSPVRGRAGRPPVTPHPSLSAFPLSCSSTSPSPSSSYYSRILPHTNIRTTAGVRARSSSFSSTHMSPAATSSPSSQSYNRM